MPHVHTTQTITCTTVPSAVAYMHTTFGTVPIGSNGITGSSYTAVIYDDYQQQEKQVDMTTHNPERWVNPYPFTRMARPAVQHHPRYNGRLMWTQISDTLYTIRTLADAAHWRTQMPDFEAASTKCYPLADLEQHRWHAALQSKHEFHPAVYTAIQSYCPADWHQLVLEYPHVSVTNPAQIAYTRSEEHGNADRQTITSVGKYLRRHFPDMPDHVLRDYAMRYGEHKMEMWDTIDKIIKSVQDGPRSCMQWGDREDGDSGDHPYNVYDPKFGWRAAVRLDGSGKIVGRCLVNVSDDVGSIFVRSYARKDDGYSHSDEALEVWLRDHGFIKADSWEGCKLALIEEDYAFLAPYLDGNVKTVIRMSDHLLVDEDGEWTCENTNGYPVEHSRFCCPDCDSRVDEEDAVATGYHGDHTVCRDCVENNYRDVIGRGGYDYYVHENDAVYVDSQDRWYDVHYLDQNGIVELDNGDYVHSDDAVYLEYSGIWVSSDDDCAVYTFEGNYEHIEDCVELACGQYTLEDNAWECDISGKWYHEDDDDKKVAFCDVATQDAYFQAHEDAVEEDFSADLDAGAEYCEAILEQQTI